MISSSAVQFEDYSFAYAPEGFSLASFNWEVGEGSFTLLLGKTGSGKTTLLKTMVPALAPTGESFGDLKLFGRPIAEYSLREACTLVGYVPQNPEASLVCQTVISELVFGLENLGVDSSEMAKRLAEVVAFFGMESWIHQEIATLSGGQKHLVALAAVLVMRPKLLLLDEPLAQLDPVAQKTFASLLFRVNKELGITIVVATHDPYTLAPYASEAVSLSSDGVSSVPLETLSLTPWTPPTRMTQRFCNEGEEVLTTNDLWFRYEKTSPWVLQGLQSRCNASQCVALLGSNGSGKTTYLQLVASMLKPSLGKVRNRLAHIQAYLPQNPQALLVCDSVLEELQEWQVSAGYCDEDIDAMLERLELSERREAHPMDLSGGEQQKLALGKLLLARPKLLILDEPTKGLDYEAKLTLLQLLLGAQQEGTTLLLATHDLTFAACLADRLWLLFDGQIARDEAPDTFFEDAIFYKLYQDPFTHAIDAMEAEQ